MFSVLISLLLALASSASLKNARASLANDVVGPGGPIQPASFIGIQQNSGSPGLPPSATLPKLDSTFWYALLDDKPAYITIWNNTVTHQYGGEIYYINKSVPQGIPWNIASDYIQTLKVYTLGAYGYYVIWDKPANLPYSPGTRTYVGIMDTNRSRINGQYVENGTAVYGFDATLTLGEYADGDYILGMTGQSCTQTCTTYGRTCNPQIVTNNSPKIFRDLGIDNSNLYYCVNDTRNWWANDQPSYVSDPTDANYNHCLGWKNVPPSVPCSGSYPTVQRVCRCTGPSWIPSFPEGTYSLITNGYPGDLNYSTASLQYSTSQIPTTSLGPLETITNQQAGESLFYEGSRYVFFTRTIPNYGVQNYTAIISKYTDHLDGKYTDHGGNYPFNAVLSYNRGANELYTPTNFYGDYVLLANGWGGVLHVSGTSITGTWTNAALSTSNPPNFNSFTETMTQVSYSYQHGAWYIKFFRPNYQQTYYAVMDKLGVSLHGHFYDQATQRDWPFDAAKWFVVSL